MVINKIKDKYRRTLSKIVPLRGTSSLAKAGESVREIASSATGGKISTDAPTKFVSSDTDSTYNVTIPSGGGGSSGGGSSGATIQQQRAEAERIRQAEIARQENQRRAEAEALRIQQEQAKKEQQRIENLRKVILEKGAQERERISRDQEGNRIRTTTTEIRRIDSGKSTNALVWKYENLDTGEVRYRSYEVPKGGGGRTMSGGVDMQVQSPKQVQEIKSELTSIGLTPIVQDGQVVGFSSSDTKQSYAYDEKGIEAFNKQIEILASQQGTPGKVGKITSLALAGDAKLGKGVTAVKNTISNLLKRSGINVKDTKVSNYVSKVASQLKARGIDNVNKYRTFVERRRNEALKGMSATRPQLKQPKTYAQALKWVGNFDRYVSNRAILTALDLGVATPQLVNQLRQAPLATIVVLPVAIKDGFKQDWKTIKSGDVIGIVNLATDYLVYVATFGLASKGVKATTRGVMKLLPGTKKLSAGEIIVRKAGRLSKKPPLVLKSTFAKDSAKTLSQQAKLAGKKVTAVTAQADQLTSLLRRKKIIRKPLLQPNIKFPKGEASFPTNIRKLLKKFDSGQGLTKKEFANVNTWLRKNVAPNTTLLERSLYLDPSAGLRTTRLGLQPTPVATLRDILRGNFKLWQKQGKPQILVFENAKIAKFPKALRSIERKLKSGQKLTTAETNKLIRWQVQTGSGNFKPIGSTIYMGGKELEITLAPGELIRRVKSLGRVFIEGKKVTIVSAEVFKPSKIVLKQMKLAQLGRLSKSAVNKLNNFLSKKLGRRIRVETPEVARSFAKKAGRMARRTDPNIPVLRVRGSGIIVLRRGMRGLVARPSVRTPARSVGRVARRVVGGGRVVSRTARPSVRRGVIRKTPIRPKVRAKPVRATPRKAVPKRPALRTLARPGKRTPKPPKKPIIPLRIAGFESKKLPKQVPTYYVKVKRRGKIENLTPRPLTLNDARDFLAYKLDNTLMRTAWIEPIGKSRNVVRVPKNIRGYYGKVSKKLRPYRIRRGKQQQLRMGYIEKRKYALDTPGERKGKWTTGISSKRAVRRVQPKRKITGNQRRELLKRLKKARAVRMKNLRRKK